MYNINGGNQPAAMYRLAVVSGISHRRSVSAKASESSV